MTRQVRATLLAAGFALALSAASCGGGSGTDHQPDGPFRPTQKISAGVLGTLPAPATRRPPGPGLVLPERALTAPGQFPIDRLVVFRVPVRNDGTRVLRITKIDPG